MIRGSPASGPRSGPDGSSVPYLRNFPHEYNGSAWPNDVLSVAAIPDPRTRGVVRAAASRTRRGSDRHYPPRVRPNWSDDPMAAVASITTDLPPIPNIGQVIMTDEGHADEGRGRRQDARASRRSKVGRVVAERELDGLGEELEAYWTGEGASATASGLRGPLQPARSPGSAPERPTRTLDGEAENLYELITGDEVTSGTRIQAERRSNGPASTSSGSKHDFVSHQAVPHLPHEVPRRRGAVRWRRDDRRERPDDGPATEEPPPGGDGDDHRRPAEREPAVARRPPRLRRRPRHLQRLPEPVSGDRPVRRGRFATASDAFGARSLRPLGRAFTP